MIGIQNFYRALPLTYRTQNRSDHQSAVLRIKSSSTKAFHMHPRHTHISYGVFLLKLLLELEQISMALMIQFIGSITEPGYMFRRPN